jgi:hypothetical protein
VVERAREALGMAALAKHVAARDFPQAILLWMKVLGAEPSPAYFRTFTDRVAALADTAPRRSQWRAELEAVRRKQSSESPLAGVIGEALRRVESSIAERSGPR